MAEKRRSPAALAMRRRELNRKVRATFVAGAEEQSRRDHGRGMAEEELCRLIAQYPGDLPDE